MPINWHFVSLILMFAPHLTGAQTLVMIGGYLRDDNAAIWNQIVELAGGKGNATFGVVYASNRRAVEAHRVIQNLQQVYGAKKVLDINLKPASANDRAGVSQLIRTVDGVFLVETSNEPAPWTVADLSNAILNNDTDFFKDPESVVMYEGAFHDRKKLIDTLRPDKKDSLALEAIRYVLEKGGVIIGTGAIMTNGPVILRGDSISALIAGTQHVCTSSFLCSMNPLRHSSAGGLGVLQSNYIVDVRLSEKGREIRLVRTLLDTRNATSATFKGLGIDENTALVVENATQQPIGKVVTAKGARSGVHVFDVSNLPRGAASSGYYEGVQYSFASADDVIDLVTGKVTLAAWKTPLPAGNEILQDVKPSRDVLSRGKPSQWRDTALLFVQSRLTSLVDESPADVAPLIPNVKVEFGKASARSFCGRDECSSSGAVCSFLNVTVSVRIAGSF